MDVMGSKRSLTGSAPTFVYAVIRSDGQWFRGNEASGSPRKGGKWGPEEDARLYHKLRAARTVRTTNANKDGQHKYRVVKFSLRTEGFVHE